MFGDGRRSRPADPAHAAGLITAAERDLIERDGEAGITLAGRPFRIRREFLEDIAAQPLEAAIRSLGAAMLVLHSPTDDLVDIDHARRIYEAARHPKSFVSIDGADDLLTDRTDAEYAARLLSAWSSRVCLLTSKEDRRWQGFRCVQIGVRDLAKPRRRHGARR